VAVIVKEGPDILISEDRRKGENIYGVPGGHPEAVRRDADDPYYGMRLALLAAGSNNDSKLVMLKSWRIFGPRLTSSSRQGVDFDVTYKLITAPSPLLSH
jgi:hypothetical protein